MSNSGHPRGVYSRGAGNVRKTAQRPPDFVVYRKEGKLPKAPPVEPGSIRSMPWGVLPAKPPKKAGER